MNENRQSMARLFTTTTSRGQDQRQTGSYRSSGLIEISSVLHSFINLYSDQLFKRFPVIQDSVDPNTLEAVGDFCLAAILKGLNTWDQNYDKVLSYIEQTKKAA